MLTLLLFLFAGHAQALADPRWPVRESATRTLSAWWPLSEPALRLADRSPDPEVTARAAFVRRDQLRRPARRGLALLIGQPFTPDELRGLALLTDPHEDDGLPFASQAMHARHRDLELRRGIASVRWKLRLLPDGEGLGLDPDVGGVWPYPAMLQGLDELRFAFRGLPALFDSSDAEDGRYGERYEEAKRLWAGWKAGR